MTKARDISKLLSTANGKIAGENLDVSFENITDTGTEGTRVATGTSAERGSTAGQLRFNTTTGLAEYYTGTSFKSIDAPPTVSSVGNNNIAQTQIDSGYDLSITGSGFLSGATVKFIGADNTEYNSPTVTVNSDSSITATVPNSVTNANEPYSIRVTNLSGLSNTLADAFNVDGQPAWQTASGSLGNTTEASAVNLSVSATDPESDTITYSETGGTVLSTNGLSINSATGAITGTAPTVLADTTLSFTLRATSGTQTADRAFSIIVKDAFELPSAYQSFVNARTSGTIYYVSPTYGSDSNNGTSSTTAFQTLAKVADTVSSDDTVILAPETFTLTGNHYGIGDGYACISAYKGSGTTEINTLTEKTNVWFVGYPQKTKIIVKDVGSELRDAPFTLLSQNSGVIGLVMERELFGGSGNFPEPYSMAIFKANHSFLGGTGSGNAPNVLNCVLKNASQSPTLSGDSADLGKNIYSWQYDNPSASYFKLTNSTIHNANGTWQNSFSGASNSVIFNNILLSGSWNNDGKASFNSIESGQSLNTTNWYRASQSATVADTSGRGVYSGTYSWQYASYPASYTGGFKI